MTDFVRAEYNATGLSVKIELGLIINKAVNICPAEHLGTFPGPGGKKV